MSRRTDDPSVPGAFLSPTPQSTTRPSSSSTSSSSPPVPSLLRTPPSTGNLAEAAATPTPSGTTGGGERFRPVRDDEDPLASPTSPGRNYKYGTVPFPSRVAHSSSSSSQAIVMSESNMSERPDTIASLMRPPTTPNLGRGRPLGRPALLNRSGRTSSELEGGALAGLPSLTPSTSRDGGDPKRVSFDNDSLQHGNPPGDIGGERREPNGGGGLKRISSSLERIKQHFTKAASDPLIPTPNSSQPPSRAQSPYRILQLRRNPHFWPTPSGTAPGNNRWERPCDPYDPQDRPGQRPSRLFHKPNGEFIPCFCCSFPSVGSVFRSVPYAHVVVFWAEYWTRQVYRHCLLRMPTLYFKRVWRIIFEAQVSQPELTRIIQQRQLGGEFPIADQWIPPVVSPGLARFRMEWEYFIDTLLKEWKTFNVVSALLLSAILTIFQIDGTNQPVTRTAALAALVSGLWAIVYGGVYVIRFQSMKDMVKASRWAEAAQESIQDIFWNVWVFLCLPAVALAYSVIFFCIAVMSYVWTAGTSEAPSPIQPNVAWIPRTIITLGFAIGGVYFYLVITTFRSYSDPWPNPVVDMSVLRSPPRQPGDDLERGGRLADVQREARERRSSLRRFGSPDVYYRGATGLVAHSAPVLGGRSSQDVLGLEVRPPTGPGGFVAPVGPGPPPLFPTAAPGGTWQTEPVPMNPMQTSPPPFSENQSGEKKPTQETQQFGSRRESPLKREATALPEESDEDDDAYAAGVY